MRDYATIVPSFWIRGSGKALRGSPGAQIVALYLFTAPTSNLIGLYYLPANLIAYDTGLSEKEVRTALSKLQRAGIAEYDDATDMVWVPEMARYQVGEHLKGKDNRIRTVERVASQFRSHRFFDSFIQKYKERFSLNLETPLREGSARGPEGVSRGSNTPSEGVPKGSNDVGSPLGKGCSDFREDQDQDQDQDQEEDQEQKRVASVWGHYLDEWRRVVGGPNEPRLTDKREGMIRARLSDGFGEQQLKTAISAQLSTAFNVENGHTSIDLCVRSVEQVEKYLNRAQARTNGRAEYFDFDDPESEPPAQAALDLVLGIGGGK